MALPDPGGIRHVRRPRHGSGGSRPQRYYQHDPHRAGLFPGLYHQLQSDGSGLWPDLLPQPHHGSPGCGRQLRRSAHLPDAEHSVAVHDVRNSFPGPFYHPVTQMFRNFFCEYCPALYDSGHVPAGPAGPGSLCDSSQKRACRSHPGRSAAPAPAGRF